jgi:hypothetical protein
MALTLPASFNNHSIKQNWLFQLHYDDESAFTGLSFYDTTVSQDYYGSITNKPSIREKIDLINSKSSTSNVSLTVANFKYLGDDFSAELYGGTRKYINRIVKIYIQPNDASSLSDCLLIYTGKLKSISHNIDLINLDIEAKRVWDGIEVPNVLSPKGNYFPLSYGDYTVNTSTVASPDFCTSRDLFPLLIEKVENDDFFALQTKNSGRGKLHLYEKDLDTFVSLDDANNSSVAYGNGFVNKTDFDLERSLRFRPSSIIQDADYTDFNDNGLNTLDSDVNTFSLLTESIGAYSNSDRTFGGFSTINANVGQVTNEITSYKTGFNLGFTLDITATGVSSGGTVDTLTISVQVNDKTTGSYVAVKQFNYTATFQSTGQFSLSSTNNNLLLTAGDQTGNGQIDQSKAIFTSNNFSSDVKGTTTNTISYQVSLLILHNNQSGIGQIDDVDFDFKLYDTFVQVQSKIPIRDTDVAKHNPATESINRIKYLYTGTNGITDNGWNSSSAISTVISAHRDILHRNTSYTNSNTPTNWSTISSAKDWQIRYWLLEPKSLKDVLEELQFNGGFIFRFNGQNQGEYIFIPDSISSDHTINTDDLENVGISLSSMNDIKTTMKIEYQKHPAENRYMKNVTSTNSNAETNLKIDTNENSKKVRLNALVSAPATSPSSNVNDDWYTYYNNIIGDQKILVSATVVAPSLYGIDVGDFVEFGTMPVDPFGESWSGKDFIVTSVSRQFGKLQCEFREV